VVHPFWRFFMAGVSVGSGKGPRRSLDSEINMIPMIDLLMVTISFLLITAVWVHSQRMVADAQVPSSSGITECEGENCPKETRLHVETADPSKFVLAWKQGPTVIRSIDVARGARGQSYGALAAKVSEEWNAEGKHREASDRQFDRAIVHAANDMRYADLIAVMDAVAQPKRRYASGGKSYETAAFDVSLAAD
jgi:biopolymer transport protein ExbD